MPGMLKEPKNSKSDNNHSYSHKRAEDFRILSQKIFSLANRGVLRVDFLHEISEMLSDFSGCEAVELWIKDGEKYYWCMFTTIPKKTFQFEVVPQIHNKNGMLTTDLQDDSELVHLCTDIIRGRFKSSDALFTKNGSLWTSDTEQSLTLPIRGEGQTHVYNLHGEYSSLVLIPFEIEKENIGLLILKSSQSDFFTQDDVKFYKGLVHTLGVALIDRRAQVALSERVKELTCLYGISKVTTQPSIGLEEILADIVELLPPAWLYPDIASAKIILDGHSYSTSEFRKGCHKQIADIVINGERRGVIEVVYSEEKPELDEGPFLAEERNLIDTIAKEVALIIERKQADEEKSKLQDQLRHADRLATIGQLAAGVAHELNEPLGNILGFAQLIEKDPELTGQIRHDIERIEKASLHAREVIRKLMTFAHQTPPKKGKMDINRLITEGLSFIESRCAKEGIELERFLSPNVPEITGDHSQLHQVLVNLVVNAIQAMPEGGKLTIRTKPSGNYVILIIEDTGTGMTEGVMKQIFVPFFTTKEVGQGTGLGLAVVHGIVTSHEGAIHVESRVGHGSRFEVRLPVGDPQDLVKGD